MWENGYILILGEKYGYVLVTLIEYPPDSSRFCVRAVCQKLVQQKCLLNFQKSCTVYATRLEIWQTLLLNQLITHCSPIRFLIFGDLKLQRIGICTRHSTGRFSVLYCSLQLQSQCVLQKISYVFFFSCPEWSHTKNI